MYASSVSCCSVVLGPEGTLTPDRQAGVQQGAGQTTAASESTRKELKGRPLVIWTGGVRGGEVWAFVFAS